MVDRKNFCRYTLTVALVLAIVVGVLTIIIVLLAVMLWIVKSSMAVQDRAWQRKQRRWDEERRKIVEGNEKLVEHLGNELKERERVWAAEKVAVIGEAREREGRLVEELVKAAGRPPVVIDSAEAIRQIGETIARITQGPPEAVLENVRLRQDVAENWRAAMGEDPDGPGAGITFTPFGDVDGWMDPEAAAAAKQDRTHVAVANGKLSRDRNLNTGQPIEFRSGESGTGPTGGWED